MDARADVRLEWGHAILTPEGVEIRIPRFAFPKLRQLGLLQRNRNRGLYQISPLIYELMRGDYGCLLGALRSLLGSDLTGPQALTCNCPECKQERAEICHNLIPDWKQVIDRAQPGLREF